MRVTSECSNQHASPADRPSPPFGCPLCELPLGSQTTWTSPSPPGTKTGQLEVEAQVCRRLSRVPSASAIRPPAAPDVGIPHAPSIWPSKVQRMIHLDSVHRIPRHHQRNAQRVANRSINSSVVARSTPAPSRSPAACSSSTSPRWPRSGSRQPHLETLLRTRDCNALLRLIYLRALHIQWQFQKHGRLPSMHARANHLRKRCLVHYFFHQDRLLRNRSCTATPSIS